MNRPVVCYYHANCMDGFAAAACVKRLCEKTTHDAIFIPVQYGKLQNVQFADYRDRIVYIVDFSFPRALLEEVANACSLLFVYDHHKTAAHDLQGFDSYLAALDKGRCVFDMQRSGAGITFDELILGQEERPRILNAIETRDLWNTKHSKWEEIRAINSTLFSYEYDLDGILASLVFESRPKIIADLIAEGRAIDRKHLKDAKEIANNLAYYKNFVFFGGTYYNDVPVCNCPYMHASDVGAILAEKSKHGFSICYWDEPKHRKFSFRAVGNADVSAIAKDWGGGGHAKASGALVSKEWLGADGFPARIFFHKVD